MWKKRTEAWGKAENESAVRKEAGNTDGNKIRKIAFVIHPERPDAWNEAGKMAEILEAAGLRIAYPQKGETADGCGMVMTFGGDGTLLMGAGTAIRLGCPLMGINLGTVGFLTEGDPEQRETIARKILQGEFSVENRELLQVQVNSEPETFTALNDAVVTRGGYARLIQVETLVNQDHWGTFTADGVIAATPTGSTGYSLSAGGPVVAPGVECMVITPVCAHSLQHCPCIVPRNAEVIFHLRSDRAQRAELQIDGQSKRKIHAGDTVRITGSSESLQLVRIHDYRFFTVLHTKLNEWSREDSER